MADEPKMIDGHHCWSFGDSPALADELLALVLSGEKTATCGALRDYIAEGIELPVPGRQDIVLDGHARPAALIEYTEVTQRRFDEVPEDFALAEGEGDFEAWSQGHKDYFARNGGWSPDMMLVCERIRLVEVLPR
jgi:uncharacterized protein YhfF